PPSVWKASISVVKDFDFSDGNNPYLKHLGDGWRIHADLVGTKTDEAVLWQDLWELQYLMTPARAAQLGLPAAVAPDGRPLFDPTRYSANPNNLTPAPTQAYPWLSGTTTRSSGSDILLTNTSGGDSIVWAIGVTKSFHDLGLQLDYTYSHQNVRDVAAATSSVATSNYNNEITADPNHPGVATSDYQILYEHRFTIDYSHRFIGDNRTSIRLFLLDRAGLPFSYAFCTTSSSSCTSPSFNGPYDQLFGQSSTSTTHQLLYVPKTDSTGAVTATSDPRVTYGPGFNLQQFNAFLNSSGLIRYAGAIAPRNAFRSPDVLTADLQFSQEFPAWFPGGAKGGSKGEFYLDVINLPNLLNRNWGIDDQVGFPYVFAPIVAANCQFSGVTVPGIGGFPTCAAGRGNFYQYNTLRPTVTPANVNQFSTVQTLSSPPIPTWVIKMGIRYKF
ncbi:MAG TPA: hypothetical protein VKQ70_01680, partial [Caulobacteraceae bacterium]|nr:hypothetical protein [Caulobacteraceae bacterium]